MTQATMEAVTLTVPADTYEGLRAQAKMLNIAGRGSMRKGQLLDAVAAEITRRVAQAVVDGTDGVLAVEPHGDGTATVTLPASDGDRKSLSMVTTSYGRKIATRDVPRVESCALAPTETIAAVEPMPETVTVTPSPFMAAVVSAVLADTGTRTNGRKGAGVERTRAHRKTYPAGKATRSRKGGRK